jgi:hypothetical protein
MSVINNVHADLRNPKCEGFFLESDGNEMTVRRINEWQFDITTESWRGHTNTDYKVDAAYVESMVAKWLIIDDHCCYVPHYPATRWPQDKVERFMTSLCPKMCNPFFRGFTLSADDADTYTVQKHPNGMEWEVDGNVTDFGGVLKKTRAKLAEPHMWEFATI